VDCLRHDDRLIEINRNFAPGSQARRQHADIETPGMHTWMVWRRNLTELPRCFSLIVYQLLGHQLIGPNISAKNSRIAAADRASARALYATPDDTDRLMRKSVHRAAINIQLPVCSRAVHLYKRIHVRYRHMRIQSSVASQYFRFHLPAVAACGVSKLPCTLTTPANSAPLLARSNTVIPPKQ